MCIRDRAFGKGTGQTAMTAAQAVRGYGGRILGYEMCIRDRCKAHQPEDRLRPKPLGTFLFHSRTPYSFPSAGYAMISFGFITAVTVSPAS